jgi:ligand-binding sensor domain-containing protein
MKVTGLFDAGDRLWVGAWNDGIATRHDDGWMVADSRLGLPGKNLSTLVVDDAGVLWLGYYDAGVVRIEVADMLDVMMRAR